jgi:hypothetical protein
MNIRLHVLHKRIRTNNTNQIDKLISKRHAMEEGLPLVELHRQELDRLRAETRRREG